MMRVEAIQRKRILLVGFLVAALLGVFVPEPVSAATCPEPVVAIHFSEYTQTLDMTGAWWHYFVMPESLKEALDSDGTPWVEVSDADISAGRILHPDGSPKYPILISLASEAISDHEVDALRDYVAAGGFLFVGSSAFTLNESGLSRGDFALADEMGLHVVNADPAQNWYQNRQFTKAIEHRLVWHIPSGTLTWRMPLDTQQVSWSSGYHYAWNVTASDAEVIANGASGPLLATKGYGDGHFIYHGALNPLIGHGGRDSGMYAYLIYRNAIEWAFEAANVPIVKLSPWRYEHDAAFVVRHDFENTPSRIRSIEASAQAEAAAGAQGDYYFCTGTLRVGSEDTGIPEAEKPDVIASVQRAVSQYGASIGSHNGGLPNPVGSYPPTAYNYWHWGPDTALDVDPATLPPGYASGYDYAYTSILTSFLDIEGWTAGLDNGRPGCGAAGDCPRNWVSPYFNSGREGSYDILQELDSIIMGEQKLSPFPHWTLSYDTTERHTHVTLPVSDWYIGTSIAQSMESGHNASTIHAAVDFYYDLGTLINLYSHQSSAGGNAHEYLTYGVSKPRVWSTNAVGVYDWWALRSNVVVTPTFNSVGSRVTTVAQVSGATDPDTAIELVIPHWDTGAVRELEVLLDGVAADLADYRTTDYGLKIKVGTTVSNVEVRYASLEGWVQTDWDGGAGQAEWADETMYESATGVDDSVDGQVRLSVVSGGDVMFSDDFTRPPDPPDPLAPWVEALGSWSVTDGVMQAAGSSGYSYVYTSTTPAWTDYSVEGRIQFPSGAYGGGIGGRVDPSTGAHYGAWVYPGSSSLRLVKFRDWTNWNGQAMGGEVSLPGVGTGWHTLKVEFVGNRIRVYYDGNPVLDVTDENYDGRAPYMSGGVSVDTWGGSTVAIAADDIVVSSPAEYGESGTLTSSAFDGGKGVQWQDISWQAAAGGSTSVRVRTRTADQADQLAAASWSDWYAASGSPVTSEDRRWIQYQVELTSSDLSSTPVLYEIGVIYAAGPGHLLGYTGPTAGESESQVVLSATQTDDDDNPVVGRAITFQLDGLEPVTGTTNASGVASAPLDLMIAPGQYGLTVAFAGDEHFGPASVDVPFEVTSPWSEWVQDTEADFQADTLTGVDASTQPGSVLLEGTLIGEGEEAGPFYLPDQTPRQGNWMQTDWIGGPGQAQWADETRYDSATGIDDDVAGQARLSVVSGGDVLFSDDFARPDPVPFTWILPDTGSSTWPNTGQFNTEGGVLNTEMDPGDYGFAYTDTVTIDNHSVEADIRFPARTRISGGGIYGRLSPSTGQRYAFWIYPEMSPGASATVRIMRFNDWGGWTGLTSGSIAGGVGTDWHHVRLTFAGNQIAVYYDGGTSPLISATDSNYTSGAVGVGFWNSSGAGSVGPTYNNFVVRDGADQIVFSDDFGPDLGDPLLPWVAQLGTWTVTDGTLQGSSSPGTYGYVYTDTTWADYTVEGRVRFPDGAFGGGLGGRLNPSTGAHYAAWLYPGTDELKLIKFSAWTTWTPLVELNDVPQIGTGWHTLKLDFQGNHIRVYYDGELMVDHVDNSSPYLSGGVSTDLYTQSGFSGPYGIQVDDVLVRTPAEYGSSGTLRSSAFDGGENAEWQTITWDAETGGSTAARVRTRTADQFSQLAGASWSDWHTGGTATVTGGDDRWIQYEAELTSSDTGVTPILHEITATYMLSGADEWATGARYTSTTTPLKRCRRATRSSWSWIRRRW